MIDLDFGKLLLLAVIALVVVGPKRLPKAARMAGAMLRRLRVGWESVRSEVERELELEEMRRAVKETAERAEAVRKAANEEVRAVHAALNETAAKVSEGIADGPATPEPRDGNA